MSVDNLVVHFQQSHAGLKPQAIIVAPLAAVVLAIRQNLAPEIRGIPVEMRLISEKEVAPKGEGSKLGVFLKTSSKRLELVGCELG